MSMQHGEFADVLRQNAVIQAKNVIGQIMHSVLVDDLKHAEVLSGGRFHWRKMFGMSTRGLPVDDGVADRIYVYFEAQWNVKARKAGHTLTPKQWLDKVEVVETRPPTEKEIEEAWEHEVFSDHGAVRKHYMGLPES